MFESFSELALVLGEEEGPQLLGSLAGNLLCTTLHGRGQAAALQILTLKVTMNYTGCTMTARGVTAKPSEPIIALYDFNADGTVTLLNEVVILASLEGLDCTILVPAQGPLATVGYRNQVKPLSIEAILTLASIKNILTSASGTGCQETYKDSTNGLFNGNSFIFGSAMQWK